MKKVEFSDVFSVEYLDIILKYKKRIQDLLSTYDVAIFMARKAICFYKAMVANKEIVQSDQCVVLSSRVLSYNTLNELKGKKIALIDDVVVRGKSISYSKGIFEKHNIDVDIHFVACEKEFIDGVDFCDSIKSPYIYLTDTNIYQLSNYITEYIKASMVPYNIDQPIYNINFSNDEEMNSVLLRSNSFSNVTDGLQKRYGIKNSTVHFSTDVLKDILGDDIDVENTYLKIRFLRYSDSLEVIAIPFVLLPEISYVKLDFLYKKVLGDKIDNYILNENVREEYENKLKVLQYVISDILFIEFAKKLQLGNFAKDILNEYMQFAIGISDVTSSEFRLDLSYANQVRGYDNCFEFDTILSGTYDYIFDSLSVEQEFYDSKGCKQVPKIITFLGVAKYLKQIGENSQKYSISTIMDILIDKGILVPAVVHSSSGSIVRGYKCGEIFNLTRKGIDLFAYMLDQYAEVKEGKPIDKIELEKLCVLFFKNVAYRNRLFTISNSFDDDCFSICYSKFGPRVSNCNKKYKVLTRSALATVLEDSGKIYLDKEKYKVTHSVTPQDEKWKVIADNFALSYFYLSKCFSGEKVQNRYVHTYNEFLTLLAIGPDKKNQMYSLMAELYLLTQIDMSGTLAETLTAMDHFSERRLKADKQQYQGIMDGIVSGMWKYTCFDQKDLMNSLFVEARKEQSDIRFIKEEYLAGGGENDENPIYSGLIDECGYLIYEIAYLFNYSKKKFNGEDISKIFKKATFYNKRFESMRHGIKNNCEVCTEDQLMCDFRVLKKRALALINQCDLCVEDAVNSIKVYKNIIVLYHSGELLKRRGAEMNVYSNNEKDVLRQCVFLKYNENKTFEQQLNELLRDYSAQDNGTLFMFIYAENSYEGIFESFSTVTGDYFKMLVRDIIKKSDYVPESMVNKVVICSRKEMDKSDIYLTNARLELENFGDVYDGYSYKQYLWIREEKNGMENSNVGNVTNFNGPITINNSQIGAIGTNNSVNQNINDIMDDFYTEIDKINSEILGEDVTASALLNDVKNEAAKKDKVGVLSKLRELAISVGSSVFAKLASTIIVDVMKVNGFFPF